jgi:transposase
MQTFLEAGTRLAKRCPAALPGRRPHQSSGGLRMENEQLKLAVAEATMQLRVWQHGAALVD